MSNLDAGPSGNQTDGQTLRNSIADHFVSHHNPSAPARERTGASNN